MATVGRLRAPRFVALALPAALPRLTRQQMDYKSRSHVWLFFCAHLECGCFSCQLRSATLVRSARLTEYARALALG